MCGRYYIDMDERERSHIIYEISQNSGPEGLRSVKIEGEVFPSDVVPVQTGIDRYEAMKWGFSKFDGKGAIINARSESALGERSMFKKSMMENRCLIPASSYFEWQDIGKRRKKKFEFFCARPVCAEAWPAVTGMKRARSACFRDFDKTGRPRFC